MASVKSIARTFPKWFARVILWSLIAILAGLGLGPRAQLFRTLVVRSGSMGAAMPAGSLAVVTAQDPAHIKVGHIITYHVPGLDDVVVSHRVIEVDTKGGATIFRTKGDKNERPDPWVAQVTGSTAWRVRAALPGLGWAVVAFRTPWVRLVTSILAPMLLAGLSLQAIWSRRVAAGSMPGPRDTIARPVDAASRTAAGVPAVSGPPGLSASQLEWSAVMTSGVRQQQGRPA